VFTLLPPLEQAPDQIAPRPFVTLSVIDVPVVNVAEPVLPTATLCRRGSRSPARPLSRSPSPSPSPLERAVVAEEARPPDSPTAAGSGTGVGTVPVVVPIAKFALTAPAVTVTLAGTLATGALLLDSPTMAPPLGAAAVNVTVPVDPAPPVTLVGLTVATHPWP